MRTPITVFLDWCQFYGTFGASWRAAAILLPIIFAVALLHAPKEKPTSKGGLNKG